MYQEENDEGAMMSDVVDGPKVLTDWT